MKLIIALLFSLSLSGCIGFEAYPIYGHNQYTRPSPNYGYQYGRQPYGRQLYGGPHILISPRYGDYGHYGHYGHGRGYGHEFGYGREHHRHHDRD